MRFWISATAVAGLGDRDERESHGARGSTQGYMYGTTAWSDSWQAECSDVYPSGAEPEKLGTEHPDQDCYQYQVAEQMRSHEPRLANAQSP